MEGKHPQRRLPRLVRIIKARPRLFIAGLTISAKAIRRTVAAHGVVAFAFNAALVALTVNIAASALSAG
jgi:hypothetical protein